MDIQPILLLCNCNDNPIRQFQRQAVQMRAQRTRFVDRARRGGFEKNNHSPSMASTMSQMGNLRKASRFGSLGLSPLDLSSLPQESQPTPYCHPGAWPKPESDSRLINLQHSFKSSTGHTFLPRPFDFTIWG